MPKTMFGKTLQLTSKGSVLMLLHGFLLALTLQVCAIYAIMSNSTSSSVSNDVKVIDVTMYSGEPIALVRYCHLLDHVDLFFIVESLESFSGVFKTEFELDVNAEYFEPISSKLIVLKLESLGPQSSSSDAGNDKPEEGQLCPLCWAREEFQRNAVYEKIKDVMGPQRFVAIFSDIDEIPNVEMVKQLPALYDRIEQGAYLQMQSFVYDFYRVFDESLVWKKAFVVTDHMFKRTTTGSFIEAFRKYAYERPKPIVLRNAGWHCSWFMTVKQIQDKIAKFSHQEYNSINFTSEIAITTKMKYGWHLFGLSRPKIVSYSGVGGYPWPHSDRCKPIPYYDIFKFPEIQTLKYFATRNRFDPVKDLVHDRYPEWKIKRLKAAANYDPVTELLKQEAIDAEVARWRERRKRRKRRKKVTSAHRQTQRNLPLAKK